MTSETLVFGPQDTFLVTGFEKNADMIFVAVECQQNKAQCPCCKALSKSVHSSYLRNIKDLPAFGNKVHIRFKTRKFYCRNPACRLKLFAERFDEHFLPYQRISNRLRTKLLKIALITGGNPGEKLCKT